MNLKDRVTMIEQKLVPEDEIIINVYRFHPSDKVVYREHGTEKIYMDYDEVIKQDFTTFETLFFLPDEYDDDNCGVGDVGWYNVCVGGTGVINENNK